MKRFLPVLIDIFAPPLVWLMLGGQLIHDSRLARRRRLTDKAHLLIRTYSMPNTATLP